MTTNYTCDGKLERLNHAIRKWREDKGFVTSWKNAPEKLLLVVSEITEAFEAFRDLTPATLRALETGETILGTSDATRLQVSKIANFKEEIADTYIRLGDLCATLGIDIECHINQKMQVNAKRPHLHGRQR